MSITCLMRLGSRTILASLLVLLASTHSSIAAADLATTARFNIAPQPLQAAVIHYTEQSGVQVTSAADFLKGRKSSGVVGSFPASEALTKLLAGTDLAYDVVDPNTVAIRPLSGGRSERSTANPQTNNADDGEKTERGDAAKKESFWERFRLAQVDQGQGPNDRPVDSRSNAEQRPTVKLEEIVVTAQKREERLIDVPQSVSVLSADALAKLGAVQFSDFADTLPGLTFKTGGVGMNQITLRGVTTGTDPSPTVGIYVDEVSYGSSTPFALAGRLGFEVGLFDVDRIEVLRGPQGTLYGASSIGGVLKYVTKRPDASRFSGDAQAGISDTQDGGINYNGALAINAPIVTDKAAVRLSGFYSRGGGYIDDFAMGKRDINGSRVDGGRADLLLTPTEALSIRVTGFLQDISRDGESTADYTFAGNPVDGSLDQRRGIPETFDQRFRLISGTVTYDLEGAALTSVSSYQTVRSHWIADISSQFVPLLNDVLGLGPYSAVADSVELTTDKFTEEVRFASKGSRSREWVIGGFYTHETARDDEFFLLRDPVGQPAPNDLFSYFVPSRYEEYAAFGDLTWHLTSKFDVTGGLRHARDRQEFRQSGSGLFGATSPSFNSSESVFTYLANARYHFTDHATGYLRYATGYRPGGPSIVVATNPTAPAKFDPDRLKSYEMGIRSETADRRAALDFAAYYIDWADMQTQTSVSGFGTFTNAPGGATIRGAELTLSVHPIGGFSVSGAFAYQDAQMSEADANLGAAKGERLPSVPRFTAALNADYELPMGSWQPTIGATLRHVSDRTASFNNSAGVPQYHLPEYTAVDLRTGLVLSSVNVQLYLHNLFDERGQLSSYTNFGKPQVALLQPRTVGVSVTTRF
jgi:iron complex outermembrane receptor protein